MKDIYLWLYLRFDGDMMGILMRDGDFLIFVEGFNDKHRYNIYRLTEILTTPSAGTAEVSMDHRPIVENKT